MGKCVGVWGEVWESVGGVGKVRVDAGRSVGKCVGV